MIYLLTLLTLLQYPPAEKREVFIDVESPGGRKLFLYDPIFARTSIRNDSPQAVTVPVEIFHDTNYSMSSGMYRFDYYKPEHFVLRGFKVMRSIAPGQNLRIDFKIIETPPASQVGHQFWQEMTRASLLCRVPYLPIEHARHNYGSLRISFRKRPPAEMKFLTDLFKEAALRDPTLFPGDENVQERFNSHPIVSQGEAMLSDYGIQIHHSDLSDQLLQYEQKLSRGPLRDIVSLVNRLRAFNIETDEAQRLETANAIIDWLDTLPEVQREILAKRIVSRFNFPRGRYDHYSSNHFYYECLQRCPEQYYQDDYRNRLNQRKNRPSYKAYLEQREKSDATHDKAFSSD